MVPFNFPNNNYSNIDIGNSDLRLVHPMTEGISFPLHQSYPFPQHPVPRMETNVAMAFVMMEAATTERNPHLKMGYPVQGFFDCHKNFAKRLNNLIIQDSMSQFSCSNFYDPISDIISEFDQKLTHLPDCILDVFLEYTNVLESLLLVSKRRHIDIADIKDILIKLRNSYYKIYSLMILRNYDDVSFITKELSQIKEEIGSRKLLPRVEECEEEMEETFATMNDEEKEDLASILRN